MPEVVAGGWFARHGMSLSPGGRLGQYPPDKMADAHSNTNSESYIHLCTQMYNPHHPPLRTELPFSFRRLQPSPVSPTTRLHGHRTSSLLSRRAGTYLPTAESEFCKSHHPHPPSPPALAPLTIISKWKRPRNSTRIFMDRTHMQRG